MGELETILKTLGNENRLRLLSTLKEPQELADIELPVPPSRTDGSDSRERVISRQAVHRHIKRLERLGLVRVMEAEGSSSADHRYVIDHPRLFAVVDRLRELATIQATEEIGGKTLGLEVELAGAEIDGPHLRLVRGVREGQAFPLGNQGSQRRWTVGRSRSADVCLDYDAYTSGHHADIVAREGTFFLEDDPRNKNGTYLNWQKMPQGGVAPLSSGDVIGLGMSLLVFRE